MQRRMVIEKGSAKLAMNGIALARARLHFRK